MNPTTNKIVWQKRTEVSARHRQRAAEHGQRDCIFHGESDGNLVAYDIKNGDELWSFQTGAGADAPAITYEVGGQQYVAILAGGNVVPVVSARRQSLGVQVGRHGAALPAPPEPPTINRRPGGAAVVRHGEPSDSLSKDQDLHRRIARVEPRVERYELRRDGLCERREIVVSPKQVTAIIPFGEGDPERRQATWLRKKLTRASD